jgi:drug/metabolite transporter (DMT)-like permease
MVVSQCTGLTVVVVIVLAAGTSLSGGREALLAVVAGVSIGVAVGCLYRGLAIGTMAIVAPIAACGAVVPVVVSLARGDEPGAPQLAGIGLAFVGIVTATLQRGEASGSQPPPRKGIALAFGSALGFGLFYLALDAAAGAEPLASVLIGRIALVGLLLVAAFVTGAPVTVPRTDLPPLLAIGLLDLGAVVFYALATVQGMLSVVSVLASSAPLITIVLARVVLRERISRVQTAGVGLTLCGVMLIAIG